MILKIAKPMPRILYFSKLMFTILLVFTHFIEADTRIVNNISNDSTIVGTLPYWLLNANNDDIIDCNAIAGQHITLTSSLPAITKNYTINGAGITINGDNIYQGFQVASGTVVINNINIQHAISKGGNGGSGYSGGGGAVGGGGALYIHGNTSVTLTASSLLNNIAQGGDGGSANFNGNGGGGGGGGFGGGNGGVALTGVSTGGGGGGHSNGGSGGSDSSSDGSSGIYFGGGGGGAGNNSFIAGGNGGASGATTGFSGGLESAGNGGGGAGNSQNGFSATGSGSTGVPGNGGNGIGADALFGAGGGGGASSETGFPGGTGVGAGGGGGAYNYDGGPGGILGGGGGGGSGSPTPGAAGGGEGGFGAGGGGAQIGGDGGGGYGAGGGNGASDPGQANGAGGGGSGLGGAIFVQSNALLTLVDVTQISGNSVIVGNGGSSTSEGSPTYVPPGNGAALGQDIFLRQGGSLVFNLSNILTISTPIEGDASLPAVTSGEVIKRGIGILELTGANSYTGLTTIEEGNLRLNGSIIGDLQIESSGTLSGNATIFGDINSSGTISPGNSIGSITTTNLNLSSTNVYVVEIDPTHANFLNATGTANLDGSLKIVQDAGAYPLEGQYTILQAGGGITGSFKSLIIQGFPFYQFSLKQEGNNIVLIYKYVPPPLVSTVNPNKGPTLGGTTVTITGTNFIDVTHVFFGSKEAVFTVNNSSQITAISPSGNVGTVTVFVANNGGTSTISDVAHFTYFEGHPFSPLPPRQLHGFQVIKKEGKHKDVINVLTWDKSSLKQTSPIVSYQIYEGLQNKTLVGTVPNTSPLRFVQNHRKKGKTYIYSVVSVDSTGRQSLPAYVFINPSKPCCDR